MSFYTNISLRKKGLLWFSIFVLISFFGIQGCSKSHRYTSFDDIEHGFAKTPDSIQTSVYWYWISDNISKSGVVKDLEAMKKVGINRAFIGNIGLDPKETPYGKVKILSDEWWDILHAALKTAGELGIEIGIFNSPGWSQSGGPWVKPEEAMRYLTAIDTVVVGGKRISIQLPARKKDFQDERVLAFKVRNGLDARAAKNRPRIKTTPISETTDLLIDGDTSRAFIFDTKGQQVVEFNFSTPFKAQSITIYPAHLRMVAHATLEVKQGDTFRKVRDFDINRSNDELNVGFYPYAPVVISFPEVTSSEYRIIFDRYSPNSGATEIVLSTTPKVERYIEKTLAKMHPTPLPYWHEYQWPVQQSVSDQTYLVRPEDVIDITKSLRTDGQIVWDAPVGEWKILRMGMTPTLVTNGPASPEGKGLEVDKMSKKHVASHFNAFLGEIMRRIPESDRKTWKIVVEDSYETGGQNWTDGFIDAFKQTYHYDPVPYLPVYEGNVIGSQDQSDRFLWDVRRLIADKVAYDYVGGLREVSHKHGLTTWLENYGHWGFPGEFLQYGGQSDEIAGEFWSEGELGNIENRAASSAAHIYGKTKVSAESSTAGGRDFARYPAELKQRTDRFFTEGINNTLLHLYIQQPDDNKKPGINAGFSTEFNRHNTWFFDMDIFVQYLKRCNYMLQQGRYEADVAYFIGEDAPKMTGMQDPPLPQGYAFDYINAEVIETRLTVKDGRLVLPDGLSYKVLVLPKLETMRPQLLRKISELVKEGAIVLGPKPTRSPSLEDYPRADQEVQRLANELWGNIDGKNVMKNTFGKGFVFDGVDLRTIFSEVSLLPDFALPDGQEALFIHRKLAEGDIYFVSNQKNESITLKPKFRVVGRVPELWNATDGTIRILNNYNMDSRQTEIPLELNPYESAFIVFRKPTQERSGTGNNYPVVNKVIPVESPWKVQFDSLSYGSKEAVIFDHLTDWSQDKNPLIKYYSGSAVYENIIELPATLAPDQQAFLDLGKVVAIAKVTVNDMDLGGVWTPPYRINVTKAIRQGKNTIKIKVVNTWVNQLIKDSGLPEKDRTTWVSTNRYTKDSSLVPAGLLGPVKIEISNNAASN